jgi:hypothetical protein
METRTIETTSFDADRPPLYSIRWAAVLAGLAVGLGVHLLLLLIGVSAGLVVFGAGEGTDAGNASLAAAIWNSISLLMAAVTGGYVAARASGLRRTADGVLHAVASWGASMLCYAALAGLVAGSVAGSTLAGAFGMAGTTSGIATAQNAESSISELLSGLERGDRAGSVILLRERFGLTPEEAERLADRALGMLGSAGGVESDIDLRDAAQAASTTSAWLSLIILLSLAAGAGGGLIGARGSLKRSRPGHYREHRVIHTHVPPGQGLPTVS